MLSTLENMTLGQLLSGGTAIVLLLSMCIEITPIKLNPISAILNWIGKRLNKDVSGKVDKQGHELDEFKTEMQKAMEDNQAHFTEHERNNDQHEINRMRHDILEFSNACQNHQKHTARQFSYIISLYDDYEKLIDKWGLTNGQIDQEIYYIKELDLRCKRKGTYLPECNADQLKKEA